MMRLALAATALLLVAGCGGSETADEEPPRKAEEQPLHGDHDEPAPKPPTSAESEWAVGETRIIEYESWFGEGTGELAQVEMKLLDVTVKPEKCAGPKNPIAVLLKFRVDNVGPTTAEFPQTSGYWLSPDGRRLNDPGCMSENEIPTLEPGQWAVGVERKQVPDEPGQLVIETAYPFVDAAIPVTPPE